MTDAGVAPSRIDVIDEVATNVASLWANASRDALVLEGRTTAGCFAGTIREAQARLAPRLRAELARLGMQTLSQHELDTSTREAYRKAKKVWQGLQR